MKKIIFLMLTLSMLFCLVPSASAASDEANEAAEALYDLGLFKGTGTNPDGTPIFDLDKTPTRNQAVIMLVRLLGKEEDALAGEWELPFTDVSKGSTAYPYIGYAYANGLTSGTTTTTYSGTAPIKANQYITFVLRALGYESGKDFQVGTAYLLSDQLGITDGEYVNATTSFTRGDVAKISLAAHNTTDLSLAIAKEKFVAYLTTPQYTKEQIDQWVAQGLTVEQWAEKIKVPADAVQLLNAINYREELYNDNVCFFDDKTKVNWIGIWNAQEVFAHRSGNCGGTSNIINFLLSGDFDDQGYVESTSANGGHIFNYFVSDGIYVFCDFVGIPGSAGFGNGRTYAADTHEYISRVTSSPQEFGDWYLNDGYFSHEFDDFNSEGYLYHLFMYSCDGAKLPKGFIDGSEPTKFNNFVNNILPKSNEDDYIIFYEREGYPLRFLPLPAPQNLPAEIL